MGVDAAEKFFKRLSDSDDTFVKKVIDLMDDTHTLSKIQKFADSVGDENFAAMLKNLSKDKIKKIINFDIPLDVGFKNTKFNYKFFEKNEEIFRDLVAKFKGKMDNVAKIEIGNFGKIKAGGYSVNTKILKLNAKLLLSEEEIYETAAHEFLHAIQFSKHASILGDASERTSMFYIKMLRNKMGDVVDTYTQSDGFNPLFNHFMDTGVNKLAMTSSDVDIDVWYKGWKKNYIGLIDSLENIPINSNFRSILDKISKEDLPNLIEIKIVFEKMEPDKVEVINKVISALGEDLSKEASNIYEIYKKIYENIKWVN